MISPLDEINLDEFSIFLQENNSSNNLSKEKKQQNKEQTKIQKSINVTVKRENGKYYTIVNIKTTVEELEKTNQNIGIDLGLKNLATLSNGQEIANLDLKKEETMIQKYQKKLSRQKYMSKNYQKK